MPTSEVAKSNLRRDEMFVLIDKGEIKNFRGVDKYIDSQIPMERGGFEYSKQRLVKKEVRKKNYNP
jgi:hypothetical protein